MTSSHHDHVPDLLGPAALGVLSDVERRALDAHLVSCPNCREELAALSRVADRLAVLDPGDVVDLGRPAGAARSEAVLLAVGRAAATQRRRARRLQTALATAASVVVLVAGLSTAAALRDGGAPAVPLEAVALTAPEGVRARADLVPHTWGVEIKLEAAGLPSGRAYTVVVTSSTGGTTSAGAFLGTGERTLRCNLNTSVLREDARSFVVLDDGGRPVLSADF